MNEGYQILRVQHYGTNEKENRRVTLSPSSLNAVVADDEDTIVQGRSVRNVLLIMMNSQPLEITIGHADLELIEGAIGSFCFE